MLTRARVAALVLAPALVLGTATAAWADPTEGVGTAARTGQDTVYLEARSPGRRAAPRGGAGDSGCVAANLGETLEVTGANINHMGGGRGAFYRFAGCRNAALNGARWVPTGGGAPPPDPAVLAQQAWDKLQIPSPVVRTSPPPGQDAFVNLPTWLWVDQQSFAPVSADAAAGPVTVTATARATRVVWDMGDGATVTCNGPGTPYVPGVFDPKAPSPDCGHTYTRSSDGRPGERFRITVTVTWTAAYSVAGASGGGTLPDLSASSATELRVAEFQALNTRTRPGR
jgi:hypothetical protein